MKCLYCPIWCTLIAHHPNATHIWWKCEGCKVVWYFTDLKHNIRQIAFKHKVGKKTYEIELRLNELRTIVHYHEPYPPEHTFGGIEPDIQETFLDINTILNVTSQNFLNKLQTYITFS
jgi:hypothetical protein